MPALLCLFLLSMCGRPAPVPAIYPKFEQLETRIQNGGDTLFVVNFWATWCRPCVEELPLFEELHQKQGGQKTKVILVSLDFRSQFEGRVVPFVSEKKLASEVILLADPDANSWMGKVDEKWDGAIPATLVVKGGKRAFRAEKFKDYGELAQFAASVRD